jgi:hypothetical protein
LGIAVSKVQDAVGREHAPEFTVFGQEELVKVAS